MIPTKVSDLENDAEYITADALSGLGGGDMLKATYDTDGDGVVDNAEKLGGVAASEYAKKTDVPTVPTNVGAFTNDAGYLTSYTETDPTVPSHVKGITTGDITNWNAKATTNYVDAKVAGIVDTAPEALNTLNELAAALGDDPNFATTVMTEIGKKVDKTTTVNGHALSGDVTVSKSDVGLGNVDNTADKDKSVKYATSATSATSATTATSATKATQDSNGNVITSTYATKNELNGKAQRISLTGQCQLTDYSLSVIALCYAPTTASTANSSYTVGRISVVRSNNLDTPKFVDIEMGAAHGAIGRIRTRYTRTDFTIFEPCTFTYNGVLYGGVKFNPAASSFSYVEFTGVTTFPIFALDVYNTSTKAILNEEVYNSLSSSTVIVSHDLYLGDDAFITGANIGSQSVASATKATQDASGNTITSTYATKTELTNGLAGKAASSHTHTKSQITDFPTSMPASDVYSWAKASSKPSYSWSEITSKPSTFTPASHTQAASTITGLATVATSGKYSDLTGKPTIPTVNNATLTIQKNGTTVKTFTANSASNVTANITVPTGAAADKGVDTSISAGSTSTNLPTSKAVAAFVEGKGYKTTDNNTTYTFATGDSNGQIKVTPSGGTAQNVSVKGLGSAAYTASTAYAAASHSHTKSQITDFPTSMPASDVYSWAKASTKPSYSWSEITSKPSTFTPASHTHAASEVSGCRDITGTCSISGESGSLTSGTDFRVIDTGNSVRVLLSNPYESYDLYFSTTDTIVRNKTMVYVEYISMSSYQMGHFLRPDVSPTNFYYDSAYDWNAFTIYYS